MSDQTLSSATLTSQSYSPANPALWQGRIDSHEIGPAPRWHQQVQPSTLDAMADADPGVALLGICTDEGVRRNQGRVGAVNGPDTVRVALANLAWQLQSPLYDCGNLHCLDDQLEQLSQQQAAAVEQLLQQAHLPVLIGGGHEIAYGSYLGLARYAADQYQGPVGILNFDAHFDLRHDQQPSSGTPFLQAAEWCQANQKPFHYACLGISDCANTQALFQRADQLGVRYLRDDQINGWQLQPALELLEEFIEPLAALYLTIDLDVLPASVMPGVSAPAPRGLPLELLETLIDHARHLAGPKLRLIDLAEFNPRFDVDGHSARVTSRLIHRLLRPL
ncbi:formimidoylglutamase [Motiliproteus sp.]|uniref:formimidoylglutamase n=1 Tax=Motiliproteus sp. TaxID=1898955 RepID=UPI003BA9E974